MNRKKLLLIVCAVLGVGLIVGGMAQAYLWTNADEKVSYMANRGITNALPRVACHKGVIAKQAAFLVEGLDYGDRIWGILDADSITTAVSGYHWESIPLDSLRWCSPAYDSLACGSELGPTTIFLYDEIVDASTDEADN